jgi:RHS repeat-associated protein
VTLPSNTTLSYGYDAAGNRVRATDASGSITNYVVDPTSSAPQVLVETDGGGHVVASYTYGLGLISQRRNGTDSFYIQDGHGSTKALTDSSGVITDIYSYDAFGQLLASGGTTTNSFLYAGEQNDPATGLYYLRARYYNPSAGRFLTTDPYEGNLDEPSTQHGYAYTQNNPVNGTDPTGLYTKEEGTAIHKMIGQYYLDMHGDYFVDVLGYPPNKGFRVRKIPNGKGMGAYNRGVRTGRRWTVRPDLRHYETGDVYEIKPLTPYGILTALVEARVYTLMLNTWERGATEAGRWQLGHETFPPLEVFLNTSGKDAPVVFVFAQPFTPPGVILYTTDLGRDRQSLKKANGVSGIWASTAFGENAMALFQASIIVGIAQMETRILVESRLAS